MWPWSRRGSKGERLSEVDIVVYSRAVCPLCDEAKKFLKAEQDRLGFQMREVDVDADPALQAEHGDWVPVVSVNGVVRFRGHIQLGLWQRLVTALVRAAR